MITLPRVEVYDDGAAGYRLVLDELDYPLGKPKACPGIGGWKDRTDGIPGWWTRVIGEQPLISRAGWTQFTSTRDRSALLKMELDGDGNIVSVEEYDPLEHFPYSY